MGIRNDDDIAFRKAKAAAKKLVPKGCTFVDFKAKNQAAAPEPIYELLVKRDRDGLYGCLSWVAGIGRDEMWHEGKAFAEAREKQ